MLVPLALTSFGLVMVYSATSASAALGNGNPIGYLERQAAYAVDRHRADDLRRAHRLPQAARASRRGLVIAALGLCAAVLVVGERINGARRWIGFGPAAFQPSELAKLALVVWCAAYLARKPPPRTLKDLARPLGLLVGVFCLLILVEPDLGTVITIVVMVGAMLLVAGTPLPTLATAYGIVFGLAAIAVVGLAVPPRAPARLPRPVEGPAEQRPPERAGADQPRLRRDLRPRARRGRDQEPLPPRGAHRHDLRRDRRGARPRRRLARAARPTARSPTPASGSRSRCKDPFGKRLAAGITALISGQAAINLAAVLGLAPLTGIPLPFVSYGGSSLVIALLSVGILLNIARGHGRAEAAPVPDRGRGHGGSRRAVARRGGSAPRARSGSDVRRVAGSRRGAARS